MAVVCIQLAYALSMELQQLAPAHNRATAGSCHSTAVSNGSSSKRGSLERQEQQRQAAATGVALVVGLLPTQLFFAFLFYTDVASLLFLLLTELLLLRHATNAAAVAGLAAIGMRQTNAVWLAFLTGAAMLQQLLKLAHSENTVPQQVNGPNGSAKQGQQHQLSGPVWELLQLLQMAWRQRWQLLARFGLLLLLPLAFCAFVVYNGGITLGDKEAHAPSAHLMQPLYFALFCLASAAPLLAQPSIVGRLKHALSAWQAASLAVLILAVVAGCAVVARYSLEHPYLLADNRHYTFYLWRKVGHQCGLGRAVWSLPRLMCASWQGYLRAICCFGNVHVQDELSCITACVSCVPAAALPCSCACSFAVGLLT